MIGPGQVMEGLALTALMVGLLLAGWWADRRAVNQTAQQPPQDKETA